MHKICNFWMVWKLANAKLVLGRLDFTYYARVVQPKYVYNFLADSQILRITYFVMRFRSAAVKYP